MTFRRNVICICGNMALYNDMIIIGEDEEYEYAASNYYRWMPAKVKYVQVLEVIK